VLFRPLGEHALPEIMKSWKGFTAREINKRIGKTGALWQDEYWDRLIRSERHFFKVAEYIRENLKGARVFQPVYESELITDRNLRDPLEEENGLENPFPGRLEAKVKSFCAIPQVLAFLKN
jgi:type I restriction enzyme, R subunit